MKKIIAMLLVLAMALALVACGASAPAATEDPKAEEPKTETPVVETPAEAKKYEGVELTYWSMWNEAEPQGKVIVEAVAAFEAETGAKVNVEWKGRDLNTVITAALEAKENVDIFDDDYARITTAYAAHTYDLTEMAEAAGYADYSYACFNDFVVNTAGYLNCIVEQPQIGGIFYNKDAFAEAGIETVPSTWAEFLDVCEALKAAGIAPLALDSAYSNFNYYFHLTRHLGEAKIAELGKNGGWAADEHAVAAAQEIIDFVNAGYLAEGAPDAYPASQTKVGLGTAAMVVCANYVCPEVDAAVGEAINWGFFNYPEVEGCVDVSAYAGANALAVAAYTENAQAAFDFILYLVTGTYGQKLVDEASHIPADTRLTEATLAGSVEALKNTAAPMSWCASLNTLENWGTMKTSMTELFEGKFATGLEYCQYLDTLAG